MHKDIAVSVVIPTFNRMQFLYATLICLIHQKADAVPYEIVIVDSGTDDTGRMVSLFSRQCPGLIIYKRIRRCKNRSRLRTAGARAATGELLVFLDCDMLVPPDFIKTHYQRHKGRVNSIVLGKRRSLTEFNLAELGEETLATHFNVLETMPCYEDDRDQYVGKDTSDLSDMHNSWRFVFSHSFSIKKDAYFAVGGFSDAFGEQWGYEDIEFGFRCFRADYAFELETTIYSYHQPHFAQSQSEQQKALPNKSLFIRLHTCFEVELYLDFFESFNRLYPVLLEIREKFFKQTKLAEYPQFDIILGCLFTADEPVPHQKKFLGVHIPQFYKANSRTVLILETYFHFPVEVQTAILHEAFSVAWKLWFEVSSDADILLLHKLCDMTGYEVTIVQTKRFFIVTAGKRIYPKMLSMYLPDIFSPQKRFVCLSAAGRLLRLGWQISLQDIRDVRNFAGEDFGLAPEDYEAIRSCIRKDFGICPSVSFGLLNMHLTGYFRFANNTGVTLLDDVEYKPICGSRKWNGLGNCERLESSVYALVSFLAMHDAVRSLSASCKTLPPEKKTICCFMENGFLEDGIDLILDALSLCVREVPDLKLIIKIPDYERLFEKNYPLHNSASRFAKSFGVRQKISADYRALYACIEQRNLVSQVDICTQNMTAAECLGLIYRTETYICASRSYCVPPELYAALLLGKNVITGTHCQPDPRLKAFCTLVPSEEIPFPAEFGLPANSNNAACVGGRVSVRELAAAICSTLLWQTTVPEKLIAELCHEAELVYSSW